MSLYFRSYYILAMRPLRPKEEKEENDALVRALELELTQKRLHWDRARGKYRALRAFSFGFLMLVILAGLAGFFFFFTRARDAVDQHPAASAESSPH